MIKKIFFFFSLILLTGCSFFTSQGTNVERPEMGQSPIYGRWTITKFISNKRINQDNFKFKELIGEELYFSNDSVILANDYIKDAEYKTKYTRLSNYLYQKFNIDYKTLGLEDSDVYTTYIFDSNSNSSTYYEVIKTSENTALVFDNGIILEIKLLDDKMKNEDLNSFILAKKDEVLNRRNLFDYTGDKGFLIGLKTRIDSNPPNWNYKTLYLKFSDLKLENVYEMNNIVLPRDDSFYEVSVQRESKSDETTDKIIAKEYKRVKPRNNDPEIPKIEVEEDPYNIGIYRDNGFWKLKGRLNEEDNTFSDFDLNLVLPYEVNNYNKINVPMSRIKNFKSNIRDGFVSPDNNFLITLENNFLKIYNISEGRIVPSPIFEREIGNDASTIMTEWATGRYANIWQEELSSK